MLKQIGKFTLIERLGRGSHSHVYRAEDPQGRPFAIKISTTPSEPDHLAQFQKDLVAAASVLHPSLVSVQDLGFDGPYPYVVMELAEGSDLGQIIKNPSSVPLGERVNVMQQVAGALKSAHERGVFHLDVRPTKIMVAGNGAAKLLDLGLGRLSYDPERLTGHGYLIGSPFYMSPERLADTRVADAPCDIWSFGVTLYELIGGRHPFYHEDGEEIIGRIIYDEPADLTDSPASLNELVFRTLEKDPGRRYRNFAELLADLKPITGGLYREKSSALFAEALQQAAGSGGWREARETAWRESEAEAEISRPASELAAEQEPAIEPEPVVVEVPESTVPAEVPEPVAATPVMEPAIADAAVVAGLAIAGSSVALDTPAAAPPARIPNPQRPERTAPRIPRMGVTPRFRNGDAAGKRENGLPEREVNPLAEPNGAPRGDAVSAFVPPPVERPAAPPASEESKTYVEPPHFSFNGRTSFAPETVGVLEMPAEGGGWRKISLALAALLLIAGALFYFLAPFANFGKQAGTAEAKTVSPGRVIKPGEASDDRIQIPGAGVGDKSEVSVTMPPSDESTPRLFDAKSLPAAKAIPPPATVNQLARLTPPALRINSPVAEYPGVPFLPAPPPYVTPLAKGGPAQTPFPLPPASSKTNGAPPSSEASPARTVRRGGSYNQPVLIHKVEPVYPPAAAEQKAQGAVSFQATITKEGAVTNLKLIGGDPLLSKAAEQAVAQWKFRPAVLNGDPVEVTQTIVVKFNLAPNP